MLRMQSPESPAYKKWRQILGYHVETPQPRSNFRDMFRSCSEECCNLLSDMLHIDDRVRASAAQCFRHPFIQPHPPIISVSDIVDRADLEQSISLVSRLHLDKSTDPGVDNMGVKPAMQPLQFALTPRFPAENHARHSSGSSR
jgi:hypothetical protein